jgi:hypothetical protein
MNPPIGSKEEIKTIIHYENSELSDLYVIGLQEMIKLDYKASLEGINEKVKNTWVSIF